MHVSGYNIFIYAYIIIILQCAKAQQYFARKTAVENGRDKLIPINTFRVFLQNVKYTFIPTQCSYHTSCQDETVNGFILSASQR